jgi:8-oxo-dGTP pyrophosphatase MutT (NUDIX family)
MSDRVSVFRTEGSNMVEVLSSTPGFTGRAFTIRVDQVRLPNGATTQWEVLEHTGGVSLVPLDDAGNVLMVRQYRHCVGAELLELPAGTVKKGEDPAATAARELQEEVGRAASTLQLIGEFYLAPGYSTELMRVYLATGLSPASLPQDEDESIEVVPVPFAEAVELAVSGQLRDAKSISGLLLAAHKR